MAFQNDDDRSRTVARHSADVVDRLRADFPNLAEAEVIRRAGRIWEDARLLARAATSRCLITYEDAIELRGTGVAMSGDWLDKVFAYVLAPLDLYDLTLLVVNKGTSSPSRGAFDARRTILSKISIDDVPQEQKRCFWFSGYEEIFGPLDAIPDRFQHVRMPMDPRPLDREVARAVDNAIQRAAREGQIAERIGKPYPETLSRSELHALVRQLWDMQKGRCGLTGQKIDTEGRNPQDALSLDRIDNLLGYSSGNVHLTTVFANRARGTMELEEARSRLRQYSFPAEITQSETATSTASRQSR